MVRALAVVAVLVALRAAPAAACRISAPMSDLVAPADGATLVPTNARIWIGDGRLGFAGLGLEFDPVLVDERGEAVPVLAGRVSGSGVSVTVLTPEAELDPGGRYSVQAGEERLTTFTVGGGEDLTAPSRPREVDRDTRRPLAAGPCVGFRGVILQLEHEGVLAVWDPAAPEVDAQGANVIVEGVVSEPGFVTLSRSRLPTPVHAGAFDVAGNFSGWAELERADMSCGCTGARGAPSLWPLLLVLALWRRR